MGNEISCIAAGAVEQFKSYQLRMRTTQIVNALRDSNRNSLKIAGLVSLIKDNNLFLDDFDSFETYMAQTFGIKKAQAYNLYNVGKIWIARDEKGAPLAESVLPHDKEMDWSVTKLLTLSRFDITPQQAIGLIEAEMISAGMSVSKLSSVLKEWKAMLANPEGQTDETDAETDSDTETNEGESGNSESAEKPLDKPEYIKMVQDAMDCNNQLFMTAKKAQIMNDKTRGKWSAAHNMANTAFVVMNDLALGQDPKFFGFSGASESVLAFVTMMYEQGIRESKDEETRKCWTTALSSVTSGLNAFLALKKGESVNQ